MAELARSFVVVINDLFIRLAALEFPIENKVFANKLESICMMLKYGNCIGMKNNCIDNCYLAYDITSLKGKSNMCSVSFRFSNSNYSSGTFIDIFVSPKFLNAEEPMEEDDKTHDQSVIDECFDFVNSHLCKDAFWMIFI